MVRRRSRDPLSGCLVLLVIAAAPFVWIADYLERSAHIPPAVTYGAMGTLALAGITYLAARARRRFRAIEISQIDSMTGGEFERYLARLLESRGYSVKRTGRSGDLGVDLIALRGSERVAIQAKRYSGGVSRRAVSDAVAAMQYYRCNAAMVVTNSYFTAGACTLARSSTCSLVDRKMLTDWILEMQGKATGGRETVRE